MSISKIISPLVPVLQPTDTGNRALDIMEENHLAHLPLVSDETYVGLIVENDLHDWDQPEAALATATFTQFQPSIPVGSHPYEALRLMKQLKLSVLPVTDPDHKYLGSVTHESMLSFLTDNSSLDIPGGIIVLEIEPRNYSLYQIARICENEDITILNTQLYTSPNGTMELTLKTNKTTLEPLVSSFERHQHKVLEVYGDPEGREDLMDKYHLLMNYLNM